MSLVIAPNFDEATSYTSKWIQEVVNELKNQGYDITFLSDGVKRNDVENVLKTKEIDLVIFYNHGSEDCLWGSSNEKVIDVDNINLLASKDLYTLSCLSGKKLGIEAYKKGVKTFIGYDDVFTFTTSEEDLFREAGNSGILIKLKEKVSWEEAFERMKQKFNECIEKAKEFWTKVWLAHDRDHLVKYDYLQPPITKCFFRKIAIKLFGHKIGWKLSVLAMAGLILFLIGYGIALHDFAHQVWELKHTIFSLEGGYIGFFLIILGLILMLKDFYEKLKV